MNYIKLENWKSLILYVAIFSVSFALSVLYLNDFQSKTELAKSNTQLIGLTDTTIAVIFFGCSTCPAANDDRLPVLLKQISEKLEENAVSKGYGYTLIGMSKESNIENGTEYLNEMAEFDEISLGNNMENTVLQYYVWDNFDHPLSASTPQVIISRRIYKSEKSHQLRPDMNSEEILVRKIGVEGIKGLLNENLNLNIN